MDEEIRNIIDRAAAENQLTRDEIIELLKLDHSKSEEINYLYQQADRVRERYHGSGVHLRGIIEFSNYCKRSCRYCGLRKDNQKIERYRMEPGEIIKLAVKAADLGYKTVVLQSGEDEYDSREIATIIREIKNKADLALTLCVGERDFQEYKLWHEIGADRYLLKHETACPELYRKLHPGMSFKNRLKCLEWLKELGYQIGSGNIVDLPGQTVESLADDILLFKELELDMIGIGPFIPHPETPLKRNHRGTITMTLKVLAVTRLLMPLVHLPATTALGSVDEKGRRKALRAGANVVMPNITPTGYRPLYEIYPSRICIEEKAADCRQCIESIITSMGYKVADGYGHSLKI